MTKHLLYDVDVHHTWASDAELLRYVPRSWRRYFESVGTSSPNLFYSRTGGSALRMDAVPPNGAMPGSDYETMRAQLLDRDGVDRALLSFAPPRVGSLPNPQAATILCRAANDWTIDCWLNRDDERLFGLLLMPTALPEEAASEIRRLGDHPRVAGVLLFTNPLGLPYGHPIYDPIYQAAMDKDLAVVSHVAGETANKGSWFAGGLPTTKAEYYALHEQAGMHHLSSMITLGTFERFPHLRLLLAEYGFAWVPWLLWSLDARYREIRRETPSVRKRASSYFHNHVWLSTQPLDPPPGPLIELLDTFEGIEDKLCYASDYPHWDTDNPSQVKSRLPKAWRQKVMADNAARLLRWPTSSETQRSAVPAMASEGA